MLKKMEDYTMRSDVQAEILAALHGDALTPKELASSLGENRSTIRGILQRLVRDGQVCKSGEYYRLPEEYVCRVHGDIGVNMIRTELKGVVYHVCWFCMAEFLASHGCADVTPKKAC